MAGFLLDVHLPLALMEAFRRLVPEGNIEHVARWRDGVLRTASDEEILAAAAEADLILVTRDVSTVQTLINRWIAEGRRLPGVLFISGTGAVPTNIGGIAGALANLQGTLELLDAAYPVLYLQAR